MYTSSHSLYLFQAHLYLYSAIAAAFKAADLQVTTQRGASCKRRAQTKVTFEFFLADQMSIWFFYEVGIAFHLPEMC